MYTVSNIYTHDNLVPSNAIVRDPEKINDIHAFLRKVWNVESLTPNPCCLPVSLERKNLDILISSNYAVAEKSDGIRYILALGKYSNEDPFSIMLDRNLTAYEIAVVARDEVFTGGTVMDGELIWEYYSSVHPPRQMYVIFDALLHCGRDCQTKNYIERLEIVNSIFYIQQHDLQFSPEEWIELAHEYADEKKIVSLGNVHNMAFSAKSCHSIANIDILIRNLNTFNHASDGLLFTPIDDRVRRGRHRTMFKWKKKHTIDAVFRLTRDNSTEHHWNTEILFSHNKEILPYDHHGLHFENKEVVFRIIRGKFFRSLLAHLEKKYVIYYEVLLESVLLQEKNSESKEKTLWTLEPIMLRKDKKIPNAFETVEKTLINVSESITLKELIIFFKK